MQYLYQLIGVIRKVATSRVTPNKWCAVLLAGLALMLLGLTPYASDRADQTYGFKLRLTTTSDWTKVRFGGASVAAFIDEVENFGGEDLRVGAGAEVRVNKSSFDQSRVVVHASVYLRQVSPLGPTVSITKGDAGDTRLDFFLLEGAGNQPFLTLKNSRSIQGEAENEKKSLLPGSMLPAVTLDAEVEENVDKKVLAFYYPWYGTPEGPSGEWVHWNSPISHEPSEGMYDSRSAATIRRHVKEAQESGIDGFVASWWGPSSSSDEAFRELLDLSEELGFRVTVYLEQARSKEDLVDQLSYVFDNYAEGQGFLRVGRDPVIFCYGRVTRGFSRTEWEYVFSELAEGGGDGFFIGDGLSLETLDVFDGFHSYNVIKTPPDELSEKYKTASLGADVRDKLFAATVLPGYDDRKLRDPGFVKERDGGALYARYWDVATSSGPEWILITSYNEWHEGTEIEASVEYGDKYLDLTSYLVKKWKGT